MTVTAPQPHAKQRRQHAVLGGSIDAPTLGAKMLYDSTKNETLILVGGTQEQRQITILPEIQQILAREGVTDYALAPTIEQKPFVELQAISGYLSRQRHVHDRPRLFAWLASRDFGAQLLQRRRHGATRTPRVDPPPARPPCGRPTSATPPSDTPPRDDAAGGGSAHQQLWQSVLATVQRAVAPEEFTTWLADTALLDLDHQQQIAVVGTPHVFARDLVQARYRAVLAAELAAHLPHTYALTLVVGSA